MPTITWHIQNHRVYYKRFKIGVTEWVRKHIDVYTIWQRNYCEHTIRNNVELDNIRQYRQYIIDNPLNWQSGENYQF